MTELTSDIPVNQAERYDLISRRIPLGRWGAADELQGAVIFLASPASNYITGAVLTVDGGYSVM
jgi:2-deoxy-D-gluconate 3-dehydrogenase